MVYIFIAIFLISAVLLLIGLVSPSFIIRWKERASRMHVLGLLLPLIGVSYIMITVSSVYPSIITDIEAFQKQITMVPKEAIVKVVSAQVLDAKNKEFKNLIHNSIVPEVEPPLLTKDKKKEEKFFKQHYQGVSNKLRKILERYEIFLYKGSFINYRTHKVIKFQTNIGYEISMKITNKRQLQSIYILMEKDIEEEVLKNIITSVLCSVHSEKLTMRECSLITSKLFVDISATKIKEIETMNTKSILVKDRYYHLIPN